MVLPKEIIVEEVGIEQCLDKPRDPCCIIVITQSILTCQIYKKRPADIPQRKQ